MAAWMVVGVVAGMMVGLAVGWLLGEQTRRELEIERQKIEYLPPTGDQAILERVLDRLMGAVIPEPYEIKLEKPPTPGHDAEYEPPEDDWRGALDWTDPFLGGEERPLVGRLAPGQGIPGIPLQDGQVDPVEMWRERGEQAFDEWARETTYTEDGYATAWIDPVEDV